VFVKDRFAEITIELDNADRQLELYGPADSNLRLLKQSLGVSISARGSSLTISGQDSQVQQAAEIVRFMQRHLGRYGTLTLNDVEDLLHARPGAVPMDPGEGIVVYTRNKVIKPSTENQDCYIRTMLTHDIIFCTGPAGTGKTYLAVAIAVSMLKRRQIRRMVLARPAVEAGEKLGYLPGDLQAKVNPYLRPLFDALEDMMDFSQMRKFLDLDIIEIIPLAFMRGRTLNESVIICDEAQNTSALQMLMVLTRLGQGSKMIITGDVTQIDLESHQKSGMVEAMDILKDIEGIGFVELTRNDIVRHRLVQSIVYAYKQRQDPHAHRPGQGQTESSP
jgi:phosphate starvation-inducible PhoH-like protein